MDHERVRANRIGEFLCGNLAVIVTRSNFKEFIDFCLGHMNFNENDEYLLSEMPIALKEGIPCVFYRSSCKGELHLTWRSRAKGRIPFERVDFSVFQGSEQQANRVGGHKAYDDVKRLLDSATERLKDLGQMIGTEE